MFKKIVVGLDGSDTSERALYMAGDLCKKYDGQLYLVHSPQPESMTFVVGTVAGYHAMSGEPSEGDMREAGQKILEAGAVLVADTGAKIAAQELRPGDAADEIVKYADEVGADLIVTGRRGLGGIGSLMLGSTTQRVNHIATTACLSVA